MRVSALLAIPKRVAKRPVRGQLPIEPSVSLLVAARNEADVIEAKIRNALALDYPTDRLIAIACDGPRMGLKWYAQRASPLRLAVGVCNVRYPAESRRFLRAERYDPEAHGHIVSVLDAATTCSRLARCAPSLRTSRTSVSVQRVVKICAAWRRGCSVSREDSTGSMRLTPGALKRTSASDPASGSLLRDTAHAVLFPKPATINDDHRSPLRILSRVSGRV